MKGFLVLLLLGFIVYMTYYIAMHDKKLIGPKLVQIADTVKAELGLKEPTQDDIHCALHFISPEPGGHIESPLAIEVIVDNTQEDCRWGVFEAQAGTVTLYDEDDKVKASGILTTTGEWMTASPTTYRATLTDFTINGPMKLVLTEDRPDGATPQTSTLYLNTN